jgi:hypothetical protein
VCVYVATSASTLCCRIFTLPGIGLGLFTRVAIKNISMIIQYEGELMCVEKWKKNPSRFAVYYNTKWMLDARSSSCLGKWTNSIANSNANITRDFTRRKVYIRARRDIPAEGDIFVPYRRWYFV